MKQKLFGFAESLARISTLLALGLGATALAQVSSITLPPGIYTPTVEFSTNGALPAFASVTFTTLPSGDTVTNGTYNGWCVDTNESLLVSSTSTPGIYSENNAQYELFDTYPTSGIPAIPLVNNANFPLVNWLLNHKTGATGEVTAGIIDIQEAIWYLLQGSYGSDPPFTNAFNPSSPSLAAQELVIDAENNGSGFVPAAGQIVGILLDGISQPGNSGPPQPLLIEVKVPGVSVCTSLNYAVLGLQGSNIQLSSGPLRITGNIGIGPDGQFNFSGGGIVTGVLYADPSAQINISGGGTTITGGITTMSMSAVDSAAAAEAAFVASLSPTQTFSSITSALTITGNGGQNVIDVTGNFHLSGGQNLTISGGASDTFYFNVPGGLQLDGNSNILLSGISPSQVVFYFPGSGGWAMQTSGNAQTSGIYLAPNGGFNINGGVHNSEFISGTRLSFQSNPRVTKPCP
jgi:hypothetical protein